MDAFQDFLSNRQSMKREPSSLQENYIQDRPAFLPVTTDASQQLSRRRIPIRDLAPPPSTTEGPWHFGPAWISSSPHAPKTAYPHKGSLSETGVASIPLSIVTDHFDPLEIHRSIIMGQLPSWEFWTQGEPEFSPALIQSETRSSKRAIPSWAVTFILFNSCKVFASMMTIRLPFLRN